MTDKELQLIDKVWADDHFLSHPRREISREIGKDGKPKVTYEFYMPKSEFYVEGQTAYANFTNSQGKPMRYKFYFAKYNLDEWYLKNGKEPKGDFEMLICGTEFI